jgi:hypothetical protein
MGTTKTSTSSTSQATPTAEETQLNQLQLKQSTAIEPAQTQMMQNAFGLGNQLLTSFGGQNSDMWKSLIGGINEQQTQGMVQASLHDITPQFQSSGIMDSGVAASISARTAADVRNQNAQFNVGALQNALNLALSGQAQVQAPAQGITNSLGSRLAGLRSTTTTGQQSTTPSFLSQLYAGMNATGNLLGGIGGVMHGGKQ